MKSSIRTYITISVICFLILATVQFYLVQNTFKLKNEQFYFDEKSIIGEKYSSFVTDDKLFKGGQMIIDSFIYRNMLHMDRLYKKDKVAFREYAQKLVDSLVHELSRKESIRSLLNRYKETRFNADSLDYALVVGLLDVRFAEEPYVVLYSRTEKYPKLESDVINKQGLLIGGNLKYLNKQNEVAGATVSSALPYSYRISWALHVEPTSRKKIILRQMGLILSLSLLSIIVIVSLFFITFRNWLRQKKLSEMKSDLINNVTHELNTPLTAITVANKNLQNEKIIEKKENIKQLTDVIQRQSERLSTLINQVLDIASMEKLILERKKYSVNELLDEILLDYRLNLSGSTINLAFNKDAGKDTVWLDRFHFTSVIFNILDNAIKYNNNTLKIVNVATVNDENGLQIIISDNGIGMSNEVMKNIFDKFYRNIAGLVNYHHAKGLGLGLYYVQRIIWAHGWKKLVKSKPGEGSTFIIYVPLQIQADET